MDNQTLSITAGRDAKQIQVAGGNLTNAVTTATTEWRGQAVTPQEYATIRDIEESAKAELSKPEPNGQSIVTKLLQLGITNAPLLFKMLRAWIG